MVDGGGQPESCSGERVSPPPVFKNALARWATYLVKETGRRTRDAVASVLQVAPPCRKDVLFNKVTRGLESRTLETRGARRFRAVSGPP